MCYLKEIMFGLAQIEKLLLLPKMIIFHQQYMLKCLFLLNISKLPDDNDDNFSAVTEQPGKQFSWLSCERKNVHFISQLWAFLRYLLTNQNKKLHNIVIQTKLKARLFISTQNTCQIQQISSTQVFVRAENYPLLIHVTKRK